METGLITGAIMLPARTKKNDLVLGVGYVSALVPYVCTYLCIYMKGERQKNIIIFTYMIHIYIYIFIYVHIYIYTFIYICI